MKTPNDGQGELIGWHDPDEAREWVQKNKSRELKDKTMSAREAVARFVRDGDFIASGGFGHVRVSMVIVYEIIRQKKKNLVMAGKTAVHDLDILVGAGNVNKLEVAYSFGHELRGLSHASRRMVQSGRCKVIAETSNYTGLANANAEALDLVDEMIHTDPHIYPSEKTLAHSYVHATPSAEVRKLRQTAWDALVK